MGADNKMFGCSRFPLMRYAKPVNAQEKYNTQKKTPRTNMFESQT